MPFVRTARKADDQPERQKRQPAGAPGESSCTNEQSPRRAMAERLTRSLATSIEEQMHLSVHTLQMLQTLLKAGTDADVSAGEHQTALDAAWDRLEEARQRLQQDQRQIEIERLDLVVNAAKHEEHLRELERNFELRMEAMLAQLSNEIREQSEAPAGNRLLRGLARAWWKLARLFGFSPPEESRAAAAHSEEFVSHRSPSATEMATATQSSQPEADLTDSQEPSSAASVRSSMSMPTAQPQRSQDWEDGLSEPSSTTASSAPLHESPEEGNAPSHMLHTNNHHAEGHDEDDADPTSRRRAQRLAVESVTSNLGELLDLSRTGARLRCSQPPEEKSTLEIQHGELSLSIPVEVVWTERHGRRKFEVGLQFLEMSENDTAILTRICMDSRNRRVIET